MLNDGRLAEVFTAAKFMEKVWKLTYTVAG